RQVHAPTQKAHRRRLMALVANRAGETQAMPIGFTQIARPAARFAWLSVAVQPRGSSRTWRFDVRRDALLPLKPEAAGLWARRGNRYTLLPRTLAPALKHVGGWRSSL